MVNVSWADRNPTKGCSADWRRIVTSFRRLATKLMYRIIIQLIWTCSMRLCRCKKPSNVQIIKIFQSKTQRALEHSPCYITSLSSPLSFAYHLSNLESENVPRLVTSMYFRTATTLNTWLWKWIITIIKLEKWYPNVCLYPPWTRTRTNTDTRNIFAEYPVP
jgi:hypothetical protein